MVFAIEDVEVARPVEGDTVRAVRFCRKGVGGVNRDTIPLFEVPHSHMRRPIGGCKLDAFRAVSAAPLREPKVIRRFDYLGRDFSTQGIIRSM